MIIKSQDNTQTTSFAEEMHFANILKIESLKNKTKDFCIY